MILLDKVEKGIQDADKGNVVSDEDLDIEIEKWLK
jgi:predicted transcriptional regulator